MEPVQAVEGGDGDAAFAPPVFGRCSAIGAVKAVRRQEEATLQERRLEKRERLGDISFTVPLPNQTCGQSRMGQKNDLIEGELFVCQSHSLTPLVGEANALEVVTVGLATDKPLTKIAAPVQLALKKMYEKERHEILQIPGKKGREPASVAAAREARQEQCGLKNITNENGVEITVSYCSVANALYQGLFSTFVKIDVHGKRGGDTTSMVQMYQGLSADATANVLGKFLESVSLEGEP